jgi:hypothetical protein
MLASNSLSLSLSLLLSPAATTCLFLLLLHKQPIFAGSSFDFRSSSSSSSSAAAAAAARLHYKMGSDRQFLKTSIVRKCALSDMRPNNSARFKKTKFVVGGDR